jgi:hypothetical protein
VKSAGPALREGPQYFWLVQEAIAEADRVEALTELSDLKPLLVRHIRHVLGVDMHHDDALMQPLVVL